MRHWQWADLAPDGADFVSLASVKTDALVEDTTTHGIAHHVVVVTLHHGSLLLKLVLSEVGMGGIVCFLEFGEDIFKSLLACLLLKSLLGHVISLLVKFLVHLLAKLLVVDLVVILALDVLAKLLGELNLHLAHRLDGIHGSL